MLPTKYSFIDHTYLIYMHKQNLALDNQEALICHKKVKSTNQPTNQPKNMGIEPCIRPR